MVYLKHSREQMRKGNRENIFNLIQEHEFISRAELARLTKMSPTSISRIANELIELNLLKEVEEENEISSVGRKPLLLCINSSAYYAIAIEINQTITKINFIDINGNILFRKQKKHGLHELDWQILIDRVIDIIISFFNNKNIDISKIAGVGVGVPGIIDEINGIIISSPQLNWEDVPIKEYLEDKLGISTTVDHLTKLKALGEVLFGTVEDSLLTVLITIGTGVGSALISNDEIYRGHSNSAGEIGHVTINENGMLCECGRRGCLQTYLTEQALIQEASMFTDVESVDEIINASLEGINWANSIVEKTYKYIGVTLCNIIYLYNPDTILLGGELIEKMKALDGFKNRVLNTTKSQLWKPFSESFKLKISEVGNDSGMLAIASSILSSHINKML